MCQRQGISEPGSRLSLLVRSRFVVAGIHGLTVHWLKAGLQESPEMVCASVYELGMSKGRARNRGANPKGNGE